MNDEEVKTEPAPDTGTKDEAAPQPPSDEEIASRNGWKPYAQYVSDGGDPGTWRSAAVFNARSDFIRVSIAQRDEIKNLKATTTAMAQHNAMLAKNFEEALKRREAETRAEYKDAIIQGDEKKVDEIEKEIEAIQREKAQGFRPPQVQPPVSEAVRRFIERNPWFNADADARDFAIMSENRLRGAIGVTMTEDQALAEVENRVKKRFPEHFGEPKGEPKKEERKAPQAGAEAPTRRSTGGSSTGKLTEADLSDVEKRAMHGFVRAGTMSKEQYLKQVAAMRG